MPLIHPRRCLIWNSETLALRQWEVKFESPSYLKAHLGVIFFPPCLTNGDNWFCIERKLNYYVWWLWRGLCCSPILLLDQYWINFKKLDMKISGPGCKIPVLLFKSGYWKLVNQLILNGFILNICPPTVPLLGAGNIWWVWRVFEVSHDSSV